MVCSVSNNKCSFKKCSIFQELNFCLKGRSEEPPSSRAAKPSPNYYPTETEAAALPCSDKGSPGPVGSMRKCLMLSSRAVPRDSLSIQAEPCAVPVPCAQPKVALVSHNSCRARAGLSWGGGSEKLPLILIKASRMDSRPPQGFTCPLGNSCMQNVGLCWDLAEKSMRCLCMRQWVPGCCKSPLETKFLL